MRSFRLAAIIAALALSATAALAATVFHDLTGTWAFEVITENGTGTPTVKFEQKGDALTGTYDSRMLGLRQLKGSVKGDSVKFELSAGGDASIVLSFAGVIVDADHLRGTVDFAGQGGANFTGTRQK